ncbi:MAG TPA: topoisomerase C-terminal repeat-containing protein, partial [Acetobacteraceae bacterium]
CPSCGQGRLGLKLGRHGSFIGCSNYPACQYTRRLAIEGADDSADTLKEGVRVLGHHPETGEEVSVRRGPYGLYVQQGEQIKDSKTRPRRTSLPKGVEGDSITLEQALALLSLPRIVGIHPEAKEPIEAGLGRFGPFVKLGSIFASLDRDDDVLVIGLNRAVALLAKKMASVRALGTHPADKEPVLVKKGRFGPYAQHGGTVANLPRDLAMEDVTLEQAVALLAQKGKPLKAKPGRKTAAKKPAAPAKKAAEPGPARKPAARKTAAKKKPAAKGKSATAKVLA